MRYTGTAGQGRQLPAGGHRQGHGRLPAQPDVGSEPQVLLARFPNLLGQWRRRNRGRHGDQHPAAQSRRSLAACRAYMDDPAISTEGLMERRARTSRPAPSSSASRHPQRLHHGARLDHDALALQGARKAAATAARSSSPKSPTRSASDWSRRSPKPPRTSASKASRTSATSRTAKACASSSTSSATRPRRRPQPALAAHARPVVVPGEHARDPRRPTNADAPRHHRELQAIAKRSSPAARSSSC